MAYSIQITLLARRDAQKYAAFIRNEQQSPAAARRWLDGLYTAIQNLTEAPDRFAVIPEAGELGIRVLGKDQGTVALLAQFGEALMDIVQLGGLPTLRVRVADLLEARDQLKNMLDADILSPLAEMKHSFCFCQLVALLLPGQE